MHAKKVAILLALPVALTVACSGSSNSGAPSAMSAVEAGVPDVSRAVDINVISDLPISDLPIAEVPGEGFCDQLATAARTRFDSYLQSTTSLACQVDSECSDLYLQSSVCFHPCGQILRTADISAVTAATASACDEYFGAGCLAKTLPCPYAHAFCDHGMCAAGFGPSGLSGSTDASVDAGTGGGTIDVGNASEAKDSALEDASITVDGGACTWPASFTPTGDDYAVGCWAHAISGTIDAGPFSCSSSEYALHCAGDIAWPDSGCQVLTMPAPDSSLGCRLLPLPTPFGQSYYCCPCGQGKTTFSDASVSMGCPT